MNQQNESEIMESIFQKIPFEGSKSRNPLAFKYYEPEKIINGKPMKDWLRFSVCFWHTWGGVGIDMFGEPTQKRSWENDYLERIKYHFDFLKSLGIEYYCFHDRDIAIMEGKIKDDNQKLDLITDILKNEQDRTGIKLLWGTANLFSDKKYMNGAATNPDHFIFAKACAQVKKAIDITHKLKGENFVFWGGREGYFSLLNTKTDLEQNNLAKFLKMAVNYKEKIAFKGQFLIEPKPREPTHHQYDFDGATTIGFLRKHNLQDYFKLNLEGNHATLAGHTFEHEIDFAVSNGFLGSIDANHNESMLGWDTDMFPTDIKMATFVMMKIIKNGGIAPGGLNFDCKVRRESTNLVDLQIGHINGMDTFAKGLIIANQIIEEGILDQMLENRYNYNDFDMGRKIMMGETNFDELEQYAIENEEKIIIKSGQMEMFESVFSSYL